MELVNIGSYPNSNDGDSLRDSFSKINDNFIEMTNAIEGVVSDSTNIQVLLEGKQDTLESGVNLRTLNGESLLGSGNIEVILSSLTNDELRAAPVPVVDTLVGSIGTDIKTAIGAVRDENIAVNLKMDNLISILSLTNQYVDGIEALLSNDGQQDAALLPLLQLINTTLADIAVNAAFNTDIVDAVQSLSSKLPSILGRLQPSESLSVVLAEGEVASFASILPRGQSTASESLSVVMASDSPLTVVGIDTLIEKIPSTGRKIAAESTSVVLASDNGPIPVSISDTVISAEIVDSGLATEATAMAIRDKLPPKGQKTKAESISVVLASDEAVSVSVDNFPDLALDSSVLTVKNAVDSLTAIIDSKLPSVGQSTANNSIPVVLPPGTILDVAVRDIDTLATELTMADISLKLTNVATVESISNLGIKLDTVSNKIPNLGQQTKTGSLPVVLASDNGIASETSLQAVKTSIDASKTVLDSINSKTPSLGVKTSANSSSVVLASDQSPIPVSIGEGTTINVNMGATDIAKEVTLARSNALLTDIDQKLTLLNSKIPVAGQSDITDSIPVTLALDQPVIDVKQININYAYSYSWNESGDLTSETRSYNGVNESRTYVWDVNGNLTSISEWSEV